MSSLRFGSRTKTGSSATPVYAVKPSFSVFLRALPVSVVKAHIGDHPPHPACWVFHIPLIPRYQMHMSVEDRLPGSRAAVDAGIESGRTMLFHKELPYLPGKFPDGGLFFRREIVVVGNVAEGDNKSMTGTDGKLIVNGVAELVRDDDRPFGVAEGAGGVHGIRV